MTDDGHDPAAPEVTVLMATRNGAAHLRQALESMAAQTFGDWEWVIVDDGSTDDTPTILGEYQARLEGRVTVLRHRESCGLTISLNRGLNAARGRFVARMDDDDIAHPRRLERQVTAMARDEDLLVLGASGYRLNAATGLVRPYQQPLDPVRIRLCLCWFNPIMHASVLFRRVAPDGTPLRYDERFGAAQDYDLWTRCSLVGGVDILEEPLITYRETPGGITAERRAEQLEATARIAESYARRVVAGTELAECQPSELRTLVDGQSFPDAERIRRVRILLDAVSRLPGVSRDQCRKALALWAEPFLDGVRFPALFRGNGGRLLRACGRHGVAYLLQRAGRIA